MENNILQLIKEDLYIIQMEIALKVNDVNFYIEPIRDFLEVYSTERKKREIYKNIDDVIERFIINNKPLKEQLDLLEYQ
jgi:hypothetical protein